LSVTLMCLVLIFGILLLPEVYCLVCCQHQHVHVTTVVAYIFSFLLLLSSLDGHWHCPDKSWHCYCWGDEQEKEGTKLAWWIAKRWPCHHWREEWEHDSETLAKIFDSRQPIKFSNQIAHRIIWIELSLYPDRIPNSNQRYPDF
jgi:hypothetical protein